MSRPERNWAFLMLTTLPVLAAATSRSVCRHRKAGICSTSHTSPAGWACQASCMSVVMRKPYLLFTSASICRPLSMPGPRNEWIDVRLALSNEALKMISVPRWALMSVSLAATVSSSSADSMTQGPAMNVGCMWLLLFIRYAKLYKRPCKYECLTGF